MHHLFKFLIAVFLISGAGHVYSQDFFAEEKDSVPDFYSNKQSLAVVGLADPFHDYYGGALWIHHRSARFSTYAECKFNHKPNSVIYATDKTGTSQMSVSATRQVFVFGTGVGSTIYENYLWYANLGIRYTDFNIEHNPIDGYKLNPESPFRIHYGAGLAAVFLKHIHAQVGIEFETMYINVGAGLVF